MGDLVDARTAARRLGVDVRTLYAYVSRGSLRRVPGPDGRTSRYDSDELELLARRSRPRTLPRPTASIDLVIATRVSAVADGLVRYRGTDVLDLVAAGESFEAVAGLLWSAEGAATGPPEAWWLPGEQAARVESVVRALGDGVPVAQRFAAALAAASGAGSSGGPPGWAASGRFIVATFIAASGTGQGGGASGDDDAAGYAVARRLWQRWSPLRASTARVRALNTALVLLAEHELALSTLAVRVAASARAEPSGCVLAGLGALSGPLHGDAARIVRERLFRERAARDETLADQTLADQTLAGAPGFGHTVHRHGDPRAAPLLRVVSAIATPADRDLIEGICRRAPAPPTVDFTLGALCHVGRMPPEASTAIFATARTAGWIAHAAEEYAQPHLRFRGRAITSTRAG